MDSARMRHASGRTIMTAIIQNLKQNRAFYARYHAEKGTGIGERNALKWAGSCWFVHASAWALRFSQVRA